MNNDKLNQLIDALYELSRKTQVLSESICDLAIELDDVDNPNLGERVKRLEQLVELLAK